MTRLFCIYLLALVFISANYPPHSQSTERLEDLLQTRARKTTWQHLRDMSHYFLEPRLRNGDLTWLEGSMESSSGTVFGGLSLNFNTLDNSLYLRHQTGLFKLPASTLRRFTLERDGSSLVFEKDFGMFSEQQIQMVAECGIEEGMKRLLLVGDTTTFRLKSVNASPTSDGKHFISLLLSISGTKSIYHLQSELMKSECLRDVVLLSEIPEIDESRFMQVLAVNQSVRLLKLHENRSATTESVSLTGHKSSHSFTDERYFLSNQFGQVTEVKKLRSSVRKALDLMGINPNDELPNLSTEKRLIQWFKGADFT